MKLKRLFVRMLPLAALSLFLACAKPATVTVGAQTWMAENLNVTTFRNGDPVPLCRDYEEWKRLGEAGMPACAAYGFDPANRRKYGLLYNWHAVSDPRGLAPEGFRIPSAEDFMILLSSTGGNEPYDPQKAARALSPGGGSGFNASFGGWGCMEPDPLSGITAFADLEKNAAFWTSAENGAREAWNLDLGSTIRSDSDGAYLDGSSSKALLFSVRCIKITPEP